GPGAVIDCASAAAAAVTFMLVAAVLVGPRRPHAEPFVTKESQKASLLQAGLIPIIVFVAMLHSWARETVIGPGSLAAVVCGAAFMASRAHARALAAKDGSRSAE